jgi:hypothetical protein
MRENRFFSLFLAFSVAHLRLRRNGTVFRYVEMYWTLQLVVGYSRGYCIYLQCTVALSHYHYEKNCTKKLLSYCTVLFQSRSPGFTNVGTWLSCVSMQNAKPPSAFNRQGVQNANTSQAHWPGGLAAFRSISLQRFNASLQRFTKHFGEKVNVWTPLSHYLCRLQLSWLWYNYSSTLKCLAFTYHENGINSPREMRRHKTTLRNSRVSQRKCVTTLRRIAWIPLDRCGIACALPIYS